MSLPLTPSISLSLSLSLSLRYFWPASTTTPNAASIPFSRIHNAHTHPSHPQPGQARDPQDRSQPQQPLVSLQPAARCPLSLALLSMVGNGTGRARARVCGETRYLVGELGVRREGDLELDLRGGSEFSSFPPFPSAVPSCLGQLPLCRTRMPVTASFPPREQAIKLFPATPRSTLLLMMQFPL